MADRIWITPSGTISSNISGLTPEGHFFSYQLEAIDPTGIKSYDVISGALPPGLNLNPITGLIA